MLERSQRSIIMRMEPYVVVLPGFMAEATVSASASSGPVPELSG